MQQSFFYKVAKLTSGNIMAMLIALGTVPILTRIYSADDYGLFAMIAAVLAILTPLSTLRLDSTLVLAKRPREALSLFTLGVLSVSLFSLIAFGVIYFAPWANWQNETYHQLSGFMVAIVVSLSLLVQGLALLVNHWGIRTGKINTVTVGRIIEAVFDKSSAICFGIIQGGGFHGLIIGRVTGPLTSLIFMYSSALKSRYRPYLRFRHLLRNTAPYHSHARFAPLVVLFGEFASWLPLLLVGQYFSSAAAGYFMLTRQLLAMPLNAVGVATQKMLMATANENAEQNVLPVRCHALLKISLSFSGFVVFSVWVCGKPFLEPIVGSKWQGLGDVIAVMSSGYMAGFIHLSLSGLFDIYQQHKLRICFDGVLLFSRSSCIIIMSSLGFESIDAFFTISIITAVIYLAGVYSLLRLLSVPHSYLSRTFFYNLIAPCSICLYVIEASFFPTTQLGGIAAVGLVFAPLFIIFYYLGQYMTPKAG